VKAFAHAGGGDQVLELQRDFRSFLRQAAFFKSISKLISFANAHQELGLSDKFVGLHAVFLSGGGERGEVYVGGDVLLAGSFIRDWR
jgi:hypothetical protein